MLKSTTSTLHAYKIFEKNLRGEPYSIVMVDSATKRVLLFESSVVTEITMEEFIQIQSYYRKIVDGFGCLGILQINSNGNFLSFLIIITQCLSIGQIHYDVIFKIEGVKPVPLQTNRETPNIVQELRKFLSNSHFYFSRERLGPADVYEGESSRSNKDQKPLRFDLTLCAQRRHKTSTVDNRFFWNRRLYLVFLRYGVNAQDWLEKCMFGYVDIKTIHYEKFNIHLALISRISNENTGTSYINRGVDDQGHVAMSIETEQAIYLENSVVSFIQIRGSVPIFWKHTITPLGVPKIQLTRGFEVTQQAFEKHIRLLQQRYGDIAIVSLLCSNLNGTNEAETFLNNEFCHHYRETSLKSEVVFFAYDYCKDCNKSKGANNLMKLKNDLKLYPQFQAIFLYHNGVRKQQCSIIRTNCYDCLERTNKIQSFIGLSILLKQITALSSYYNIDSRIHSKVHEKFRLCFKHMWLRNASELNSIFKSNDSLFVRTVFEEIMHSVTDLLMKNTFLPSTIYDRLRAILPPQYMCCPAHILRDLTYRMNDYTKVTKVQVGIGTYNANGNELVQEWSQDNLSNWLLPHLRVHSNASYRPCDIYAVGFQNIVPLQDTGLSVKSNNLVKIWSTQIEQVLSTNEPYILVTFCQMFGICLFIFIKKRLLGYVKEVNTNFVKTEEESYHQSKGAVAIRFSFCQSNFCFICAHLSDGYTELSRRNEQCRLILSKLSFSACKSIEAHDHIFFFGCLNYYIDANNERARALTVRKDYIRMSYLDQLHTVLTSGELLHGFEEPEIHFPPSHMFDKPNNSEKCPGYIGRILWKANPIRALPWGSLKDLPKTATEPLVANKQTGKCQYYGRAETKLAENNNPIFAIYQLDVRKCFEEHLYNVYTSVVEKAGPCNATVRIEQDLTRCANQVNITKTEIVNSIIEALNSFGVATIIRFEENSILATLKDLDTAMTLANSKKILIDGLWYTFTIKTTDWIELAKLELKLESDNTTSMLCNTRKLKISSAGSRIPTPSSCPKVSRSKFVISNRPSSACDYIKASTSTL